MKKKLLSLFTLAFIVTIVSFTAKAENGAAEEDDSGYNKAIAVDWNIVNQEIDAVQNTSQEKNINILTGGTFEVSADILNRITGKDITLAMQTGNGLGFSISGSNVKKADKPVNITLVSSGIPPSIRQQILEDASASYEFSMSEKSAYPFPINVHMDLGAENAGRLAMLFYYDETANIMRLTGTFRVTDSGQAMFGITRGDEYIAVVADHVEGYIIRDGDSMSRIAARKGVSLNALSAANPQISDIDFIRPGQIINIPCLAE